jgi:hypothetical protein
VVTVLRPVARAKAWNCVVSDQPHSLQLHRRVRY